MVYRAEMGEPPTDPEQAPMEKLVKTPRPKVPKPPVPRIPKDVRIGPAPLPYPLEPDQSADLKPGQEIGVKKTQAYKRQLTKGGAASSNKVEFDEDFQGPAREAFNRVLQQAKQKLYMNPGDENIYSRERGLGPMTIANRLEKRGIDVKGLIGNRPTDSDMKKGGIASSRADGCCTKGKTKGRMI